MRPHTFGILAAGLALLAIAGCSDLKETLPAATTGGVRVHPEGWTVPASNDFHGKSIKANNWDISSCQKCHSSAYSGGTSGASCLTCHTSASGPENCSTCHGSSVNPAPPMDLDGNTTASAPGVGAHQTHLIGGSLGKSVACAECHAVPASLTAAGHIDSTARAEVLMNGPLSRTSTSGVTPIPSYTASSLSCGGTYCHGSFTNGNTTNAATWTIPSSAACGTCHGQTSGSTTAAKALPTGGTHPAFTQCSWCHDEVVDASTNIIAKAKHIDGQVQVISQTGTVDCSKCHGSTTSPAPPVDLGGNSAVTASGVGAHQPHLQSGGAFAAVACAECHTVPASLGSTGHIDSPAPAELVFGTLARKTTTGVTPSPSYTFTNNTCGSTYCHGAFKNGNSTNAPVWNSTAGSGATCGSCHGNNAAFPSSPLPKTSANGGTHPAWTYCSWCHGTFDGTKHVNGTAELLIFSGPSECARCHGSATNAAPPADLAGNTATTARGVGAHQAHLVTAGIGKAVKCAECHTVPTTLDYTGADGHLDLTSANAEVLFQDTLASLKTNSGALVPNPTYTSSTLTCSNTYCHGTFQRGIYVGNLTNTVTWTDPTTSSCGSCHGNKATGNPLPTGHFARNDCHTCHTVAGESPVATETSPGTWTITNPARHVNGKVNYLGLENSF